MHFQVRRATSDDCRLYFEWANDPVVRHNSINQAPIPWENHQQWFTRKLEDEHTYLYLVYLKNQAVGQVRFDIRHSEAIINYSMAEAFRGKGLSKPLLQNTMHQLQEESTQQIRHFKALVKPENIPSVKVFEKLDFTQEEIQGEDYLVFYHKFVSSTSFSK